MLNSATANPSSVSTDKKGGTLSLPLNSIGKTNRALARTARRAVATVNSLMSRISMPKTRVLAKGSGTLASGQKFQYGLIRGLQNQASQLVISGGRTINEVVEGTVVALKAITGSRPARYAMALGAAAKIGGIANGGVIISQDQLQGYQDLGAQHPSTIWFAGQYNDGSVVVDYHFSGIAIGRATDGGTYILSAAHTTGYPFQSVLSAGYGADYRTPQGTLNGLSLVERSSNFNPGDPNSNAGDWQVFYTSDTIPTVTLAPVNSIVDGDIAVGVGYGTVSSPSDGRIDALTGNRIGWRALTLDAAPLDYEQGTHFSLSFNAGSGIPYTGAGNNGDSGGPIFNSLNQLIGLTVGTVGGYNDSSRYTVALDLTEPWTREADFARYTMTASVPEPGSTALFTSMGLAALAARRMFKGRKKENQ